MKFFKKKTEQINPESDVSELIAEIHHSFEIAGDELIKQANAILSSSESYDKDKFDMLLSLGFTNTQEYKKAKNDVNKKEMEKNVLNAIMDAKTQFPTHKYITYDRTLEICKKYNLILGLVNQYKGFVPKKNLLDINNFYKLYESKVTYYSVQRIHYGFPRLYKRDIFDEYGKRQNTATKEKYEEALKPFSGFYASIQKDTLFMCAPLKDMDTEGYEIKNNTLVHIPDPIVLNPFTSNGVKGFIIVTAWGDESKDPDIVNQNNN